MIEYLRIHNLGIIRDAQVELGPGLTVLTGETGAGKTMVLTALDLLLGGKSDAGLAAASDTRVQGTWLLDPANPLLERVTQAGGVVDDGELVLSRTLPANGRSRCSAGGTAVPQSMLAAWGEQLVAVHGQSDQSLLRRESAQRAVLDRYAGPKLSKALATYAAVYAQVQELDGSLDQAVAGRALLSDERARLARGLEDIEQIAPVVGEDEQLADRAMRLGSLEELNAAAYGALTGFIGDGDAHDGAAIVALAANAKRALEAVTGLDPELAQLATRIAEVAILANEVGVDLSRYLSDLDSSPGELDVVQARRAELGSLTRLYGPTLADVLDWSGSSAARILEIDRICDVAALRAARTAKRLELAKLASTVSALRTNAAQSFSERVSEELRGLSMPDSELVVDVASRPPRGPGEGLTLPGTDGAVGFGPDGVDEVVFRLSAHRGAPPAPLAKAASGGELSRVMLALEVVLAGSATAPTFVFDEVDAGVGGRAAVEVGRRLARLGRSAQVLVVTHLPQVAAFADHHLIVSKSDDGQVTTSDVRNLDTAERVLELARMLAGQDQSVHAAAHATELLDLAALERSRAVSIAERS